MARHVLRSFDSLDALVRPLAVATAGAAVLVLAATGAEAAHPGVASPAAVSAPVAAHARAVAVARPVVRATGGHQPAKTRTVAAATRAKPTAAHHLSRSQRRTAWVRPVRGRVTSHYGRRWGGFHPGIDVGARWGAKVHAITAGRIVSAGWIAGYGNVVRVRSGRLTFYYPHLSRIRFHHGRLRTGEVLGRVGSTGYSTGPHLHVEIRVHGHPVNPAPILRRHGVRL